MSVRAATAPESPVSAGNEQSTAALPSHTQFPCLDGLRTIAASSVFVFHLVEGVQAAANRTEHTPFNVAVPVRYLGSYGVAIFFVISGFLLYRPFVLAAFESRRTPRVLPFWKRRFARIYPAYWVALTVFLVLGFGPSLKLGTVLTLYPLLQNYRTAFWDAGIGVEWTLVIEVSFYIALPLIAWALRKCTSPNADLRAKVTAQIVGITALGCASMLLRGLDVWGFDGASYVHNGSWFELSSLHLWLVSYLDWFGLGMLLAVGSAWLATGNRLPWFVRALGERPWVCWLIAFELFWVGTQLNLSAVPFLVADKLQPFGVQLVFGFVALFMVFPAAFGPQDRGLIRALLRSRVMVALGVISYGIYLWHPIWTTQLYVWTRDSGFPASLVLWTLISVPLTVLCAAASYFFVERPVMRWAHRRPETRPAPTPERA
jgi:peptidoglycan/LPS O-acetylase OafA/YrhL